MVPRGYELVYDNYNALVFGYGPSEKTSEAPLSLAAYPRWVTLFFLQGTALDDPLGRIPITYVDGRNDRFEPPAHVGHF